MPAQLIDPPGTDRRFEIVPSVLPADFANLGQACIELEEAGVDRIQFDIMDGRFVPNLTFGPDTVASVRSHVRVPFEAHLMVHEPDWLVPQFVDAGCELIIIHAESVIHLHRSLGNVAEAGARAAVALNPATPVSAVANVLDLVEMVLVMTVNPGFGGQSYIATMEPKIAELRRLILDRDLDVDIEVDGGIGPPTIAGAARAGANVLVAGSALFRDAEGLGHAVDELRGLAEGTVRHLSVRTGARIGLFVLGGAVIVGGVYVAVDRYDRGPEPDVDAYCAQIADLADLDRALGNLDVDAVQAALPTLEELELVAPAEVRDEVEVLHDTVAELAAAMAAAPSGDTAALEEVWREREADVREIQAASQAIVTYTDDTCGLDLLRGTGTTTGTGPAGTATSTTSTVASTTTG